MAAIQICQLQIEQKMGNRESGNKYTFEDHFYVLEDGFPPDSYYKLQSKQTDETFVGREMHVLDRDDAYQIECIINQKIKNPSPFVTKLLNAEKDSEGSYCSSNTKFYLLYREVSQTLSHQIQQRRAKQNPFTPEQVMMVLIRVAKGLKYLYQINHHHGNLSSKAITWPLYDHQSIQVIDEWALRDESTIANNQTYQSHNYGGRDYKYADDLYKLGIICKEMLQIAPNHSLQNNPLYENLNRKIFVLLSGNMIERYQIYNMFSPKDHELQNRKVINIFSQNAINSSYQPNPIYISNPNPNFYPNIQLHPPQTHTHVQPPIQNQSLNYQTVQKSTNYGSQNNLQQQKLFEKPIVGQPQFRGIRQPSQIQNALNVQNKVSLNPSVLANIQPAYSNNSLKTNYTQGTNVKFNNISVNFSSPSPLPLRYQQYHKTNFLEIANKNFNSNIGTNANIKINSAIQNLSYPSIINPTPTLLNNINKSKFEFTPSYNLNTFDSTSNKGYQPIKNTSLFNNNILTPSFGDSGSLTKHFNEGNTPYTFRDTKLTTSNDFHSNDQNLFTTSDFFSKLNAKYIPPSQQDYIKIQSSGQSFSNVPPTTSITSNFTNIEVPIPPTTVNEEQNYKIEQFDSRNPQTKIKQSDGLENIQVETNFQATKYKDEANNYPLRPVIPVSVIPELLSQQSGGEDEDRQYVVQEYQNGSRYEGQKLNGLRDGQGKFYYQEGSYYEGHWKKNNMHGYGKLYYPSHKLAYEGDWFMDQFHGYGKVYNDQPAKIIGSFDYTNFENLDQRWKNYEGTLVCDSKQGYGKLVLSNGQYYEGNFQDDRVHGKGKFVTLIGQTVEGIWEDSRLVKKL